MLPESSYPLLVHQHDQIVAWRNFTPVTREQFLADVFAVAESLPENSYAINLCGNRYNFLVAFAATLVKAQTSLLLPNRAEATIRQISELYPDCYCITDQADVAGLVNPVHITIPLNSNQAVKVEMPVIDAEHLACIVFTSGSTGKPSPNYKTWGCLVRGTRLIQKHFQISYDCPKTIVATVPPQHMYGLESSIVLPLVSGSSTVGERPFFPEDVRLTLETIVGPRILVTTPVHLKVFVEAGLNFPPVDFIISATAPLAQSLAKEAERVFSTKVMEIYGCSECGSMARRQPTKGDGWKLFDGITIEQKDGVSFADAAHLEKTEQLHDEIELLPKHQFKLMGRTSDMLNVAGKRASLADLNIKLNQIKGIVDGVIFCPEDGVDGVNRLVAVVSAPDISEQDIIDALKKQVDPVFLPRRIHKTPLLPRNKTGKISRAELLSLLGQLRAVSQSQSAECAI